MDLSFARRIRLEKAGLQASTTLASLLAELSARQAVSPTALAQIQTGAQPETIEDDHPEIAQFAPCHPRDMAARKGGSFNTQIASEMLTQSKSL